MARPQHIAFVLAAALAAGTGMTLSSTAAAVDSICPSSPDMGSSTSGDVSPSNRSDFWSSNSYSTPRTFTLSPSGGDADLYVYPAGTCTVPLCSSTQGGQNPDTCTISVPGPVNVEVRYFSSSGGAPVSYALSTTGVPAAPLPHLIPVVQMPGYPSDDCARDGLGQDLVSGFAGDTYVTLRTQNVGNQMLVCTRVDAGSTSYGGKLVATFSAPTVKPPYADGGGESCSAQPGNRRLANVLNQVILDLYTGSDETWICLRGPLVNNRVVVPLDIVEPSQNAVFYQDAPGRHVVEHDVPEVGSGSCQAATWGKTRYADVATGGSRTYLYTHQQGGQTDLCIGQQEPGFVGGVLSVKVNPIYLPTVRPAYSGECTEFIAAVGTLSLYIGRTGNSASACLFNDDTMVAGVTATGSGGVPVTVTWTPDDYSIVQ